MAVFAFFVICCVCIFVWIFFLVRKVKHQSKYLKNIPGPKPIFPIGNTWDFISGSTVFLQTIMKYLNKYGDTIVAYDGAFSRIVCTLDYELLEYFYSSTEHIEKAKQYNYFQKWMGKGLLTSTGHKWRAHRKVLTPAFHFSILKDFVAVFETVGDSLLKQLQKEAGKDDVEISKTVSSYALDVICETAMGININSLEGNNSMYIQSIKTQCNVIVSRIFSPLHDIFYPLTWNFYKELKAQRVIQSFVEGAITQRIEKQNSVRVKDRELMEPEIDEAGANKRLAFLDLLLQAKIHDQPLSREEIKDEVNTFMFEGHDTTSSAISFCLLMLATHPEAQKKVLKEQLDIFNGDFTSVKPSSSQLNEMKYLELVIKETLRLFPPVPFIGRRLANDIEFKPELGPSTKSTINIPIPSTPKMPTLKQGVLYPKGLIMMLFPFAAHRSPKYFPEPEKFIPERFKDQSEKLPFLYTPFSAGPRNCIGQKFAMLEMISVVSKVIRRFELGPAIPEHKVQLAPEVVLISKNGVRISIKNRILSTL